MADRTIEFAFKGDMSQLEGEVRKGTSSLQSFESKGVQSAKNVGKALGGFAVGAAAALALAGAAAIKVSANLNQLAKDAKRVGSSVTELQKLQRTLDRVTDGSANAAETAKFLGKNLSAVRDGAGEAALQFGKLGLDINKVLRMPVAGQVRTIAGAFPKLADEAEQTSVALALFGRAGSSLVAAFRDGGADFDEAAKRVEAIGVSSEDAAVRAEILQDALGDAQQAGSLLATTAADALFPALSLAADGMTSLMVSASRDDSLQQAVNVLGDIAAGAVLAGLKLLGLQRTYAGLGEVSKISRQAMDAREAMAELDVRMEKARSSFVLTAIQKQERLLDLGDAYIRQEEKAIALELKRDNLIRKNMKGIREGGGGPPSRGGGGGGRGGGGGGTRAPSGGGGGFGDILSGAPTALGAINEMTAEALPELEGQIVSVATAATRATAAFRAFADEGGNAIMGAVQNIASGIQQLTASIGSAIAEEMETTRNEIEGLEDDITNAATTGAKRRFMIQKAAKEAELEEHKKAAMAAWVVGHIAAIAQAAINIPLTISQTIAQMGATPLGIGLAIAGGVTAGIAFGAVVAEPAPSFHSGGMITGRNIGSDPNAVSISARPGEFVSTPAAVSRLGRDTLEDAERGRAPSRGGSETRFYYEGRDLDRLHSDRLRAVGSPLSAASSRRAHSRYSSGKVRNG